MTLVKVLEGDLADFDEPVIEGLPLCLVDGQGGNGVVKFIKTVNEAFDGELDVVGEELETFEFDDDGEAPDCCSDLRDEDLREEGGNIIRRTSNTSTINNKY